MQTMSARKKNIKCELKKLDEPVNLSVIIKIVIICARFHQLPLQDL